MALSPLNRRRLANFRANRRGWWSLWVFAALFAFCLFAEFIANDRPLVVRVSPGVAACAIALSARPGMTIASPMPAQPQNSSSMNIGRESPVGSPMRSR